MKFERKNTIEGREVYEDMEFKTADSEIRNPDGSIVFCAKNIEIPEAWSQVAADVLAQKYFRKAGVPKILKKVNEEGVPIFLQRSVEDKDALEKLKVFAEKYGHARVNSRYKDKDGFSLGGWVRNHRKNYKHNESSEKDIKELEAIKSWSWKLR